MSEAEISQDDKYVEDETKKMCKLLYRYDTAWETASGWDDIIKDFSVKCEELNMRFYKKYRLLIYTEQIKQKWGELRLYCTIKQDPGVFLTFVRSVLKKITDTLFKVKYDYKQVIDEPRHKNHYIKVFKDRESAKDSGWTIASNVKDYDWCGRFVRVTEHDVFGTQHMEATKHKFLRKILTKLYNWKTSLARDRQGDLKNMEIAVIREYMDSMLKTYIAEAEDKAAHTCESCGKKLRIDDDHCWTTGWVRLLCKECAINGKTRYYSNRKLYEGQTLIGEKKDDDED